MAKAQDLESDMQQRQGRARAVNDDDRSQDARRTSSLPPSAAQTSGHKPLQPPRQDTIAALAIRDVGEGETGDLVEAFFKSTPPDSAYDYPGHAAQADDDESAGMAPGAKRAMWAALGMFALSVAAIGGFSAYHHFAVPEPVELGTRTAELTASEALAPIASALAEQPAPEPRPATPLTAAAEPSPQAPDLPQVKPEFSVTLHTADMLAHGENPRAALGVYDAALQLAPNSASAIAGKAAVHLNLGEHAAAKQLAARALELDPSNSQGWMVLGSVEDQLGATAAAQDAYRQCADRGVGAHVPECRKLVAKR
jgi:tetratricopeptide (TPR) repeat protein